MSYGPNDSNHSMIFFEALFPIKTDAPLWVSTPIAVESYFWRFLTSNELLPSRCKIDFFLFFFRIPELIVVGSTK